MDLLWRWMEQDLALARRAPFTTRVYLSSARAFAAFHGRHPGDMGQAEVRAWVDHLRGIPMSPQRFRQHLSGLAFLYRKTLGRPEVVSFFAWPAIPRKLPAVLDLKEVAALLEAVPHPTYRMLFRTMVATGLRIREACRLRTCDLDPARGLIRTVGKGGAERQVALPAKLLKALRRHCRETRPVAPWLFTGRLGRPLDPDHARRVFRAACRASGLARRATPHALRHTYATFLLEAGADLRVIQALLGHASIRSTEHYLRVSTRLIAKAPNPLDQMPG
jgi:site-specific recombinase XerD